MRLWIAGYMLLGEPIDLGSARLTADDVTCQT